MTDLYLDNDISAVPLQSALRGLGYTVRTARQLGRHDAEDEEQLLFAAQNRWVLVSRNADDFSLLHHAWLLWS